MDWRKDMREGEIINDFYKLLARATELPPPETKSLRVTGFTSQEQPLFNCRRVKFDVSVLCA